MFKIFLLVKEPGLNKVLSNHLAMEGWEVFSFSDEESAWQSIHEYPHLLIFEITIDDSSGYALLKQIKDHFINVPLLLITTLDADSDCINNLDLVNDDFLITPFLPPEMIFRAKRLLKRAYPSIQTHISKVNLYPYILDEGRREVRLGSDRIKLTSKEFDLLLYFTRHYGKALSREQIINQIWGDDRTGTERSVDDLVRRLRNKMQELQIETLYGYGYRMNL